MEFPSKIQIENLIIPILNNCYLIKPSRHPQLHITASNHDFTENTRFETFFSADIKTEITVQYARSGRSTWLRKSHPTKKKD
jgi:hypothetical protein